MRRAGEFIAETVIYRDGIELGNGPGYAAVSDHNNDGNAALRMAKKRSYIDAVLSVTGASSIFTQDYGESTDPVTRNQLSYISSLTRGNLVPPGCAGCHGSRILVRGGSGDDKAGGFKAH
jgi:hypothetical protein